MLFTSPGSMPERDSASIILSLGKIEVFPTVYEVLLVTQPQALTVYLIAYLIVISFGVKPAFCKSKFLLFYSGLYGKLLVISLRLRNSQLNCKNYLKIIL